MIRAIARAELAELRPALTALLADAVESGASVGFVLPVDLAEIAHFWDGVGAAIADEWDNRKRLAPGVTTPAIDDLVVRARAAGATAAKVCGAGGGGCLFCYGPPEKRSAIRDALAAGGARLLDFHIERDGLTRG